MFITSRLASHLRIEDDNQQEPVLATESPGVTQYVEGDSHATKGENGSNQTGNPIGIQDENPSPERPLCFTPPTYPDKGIGILPAEVLRQIILLLVIDPDRPTTFSKNALLPLVSTSKALRAVSTEFLYGSMDLFEASFGLRHRVLPSDTIITLFHDLITPTVPSFIRSGVRRLLIRDRDRKAFQTSSGPANLSGILNRVQNLRSIHFDGHFYHPNTMEAELDVLSTSRLNQTLVNLTFLSCDPHSPVFPRFLAQGHWTNLTRIHYSSLLDYGPSPFARFQSSTDPLFPYLSTFVMKHSNKDSTNFKHVLAFLTLHRDTLERLSVATFGHFVYDINTVRPDYEHESDSWEAKECTEALWECLPNLHKLRLLDLGVDVTYGVYAPDRVIRIPSLRAVSLHTEVASQVLHFYHEHKAQIHPIISFFNKIPSRAIAYVHGDPVLDQRYAMFQSTQEGGRTHAAEEWFTNGSQLHHVQSFTHRDVKEGTKTWVVLEGGGLREVKLATEAQRRVIEGQTGGWSVGEDAELLHRFV